MAAILRGQPGHGHDVTRPGGDLVVAAGAPVRLHGLERVDEPHLNVSLPWSLCGRLHDLAEQGPEEQQEAQADGGHHDPHV